MPTPTDSQLFVLDLLTIVCADACRVVESSLTARDKTFPVSRYRMLFLTLARQLARKPNGRPAQLTMLAAYVRLKHPSVLYSVTTGNRILAGDASVDRADEFRHNAATVLAHLAESRIGGEDLATEAGWRLPPASRMVSSIVLNVIEEVGHDRYRAYLKARAGD